MPLVLVHRWHFVCFKALLEDCKEVGAPFLECIAQSETLVGMATKVGQ